MAEQTESQTCYEIYGIRYGENLRRTRGLNFIRDARPEEPLPMDFYSWVLKAGDTAIVVDTGMHPEKAATHGHDMLLDPIEGVRLLGVDPERAETVIITHLHFDHTGNLQAFPKARFLMQAEEMAYATGPLMEKPWFRRAYEPDEVAHLVHSLYDGRLELHGREKTVADGVSVHWVGGHCVGQEVVRVRTARGWVVLASDALHYYEELERGIPFAISVDVAAMLAAHDRIRELADSDDHVIPAHDPRIAAIYPPADADPNGRIVRLDLPPGPRE